MCDASVQLSCTFTAMDLGMDELGGNGMSDSSLQQLLGQIMAGGGGGGGGGPVGWIT